MTLLLMLLMKSLLVFAMSGIALLCLRRASASARHMVCLLTLFALLALPLFSLTLPGWHVAALQEGPTPQQAATLPQREGEEFRTKTGRVPPAVPPDSAAPTSTFAPSTPPRLPVPGGQALVPGRFLLLYFLGVLLASARPLLGLWGIVRLRRACVPVTDAPTLSVSADSAAALRLPRLPLLCRSDVPVPMTWGGRRPVVLLPSGSEGWPEDRLRSVLLHEMAHVKRRDWSCHRLADFACAVYWFHPLVWLIARRLRAESEIACDDLVLSSGIAAPDYARHLLEIAGALSRPLPTQSAIAMAHTSKVEGRIKMVLDSTRRRTSPRRFLMLAAVTGAAVVVPLSMLQPTAKAQTASVSTRAAAGNVLGIQLIGIANTALPGSKWWDRNGNALSVPLSDVNLTPSGTTTTAYSDEKALLIAFHLPTRLQDKPLVYDVPGTMGSGVTITSPRSKVTSRSLEFQMHNGVAAYEAAFPLSLARTDVQIGVATGLGAETVNCTKRVGKVLFQRPSGEVAFALTLNPRYLLAAQNYARLVVSDHFRKPSPRKTSLISSLDGSLQAAQHDGENYDRAVYALDKAGQVVTKLNVFSHTWPDEASRPGNNSLMKTQQIAHIPNSLLKRVASFRLVARPYQWTEFKDVALKPVKP